MLTSCVSPQNDKPFPSPTLLDTSTSEILQPPTQKNSKNQDKEEIKSEIRKKTVLITGKSTGTGIIVGQESNKYYVLTSRHVVGIAPSKNVELPSNLGDDEKGLTNREDPYQVTTYDGQNYDVVYDEVEKDANIDLAIIIFKTPKKSNIYPVANLAALPISKEQKVFVYGFKDCFKEGREKREEFNQGTVLSTQNKNNDEGYTIKYTNPTIKGMSGSPVLDTFGRVVAIHGKPGSAEKGDSSNCSALTQVFGNNYGISIESFKNSSLASKLQGKLSFDSNPIEVVAPKSSKLDQAEKSPNLPVRFTRPKN